MFCYNTKNALTADSIKKLAVMSVLSGRVKLRPSSFDDCDEDLDKSECPDFMWVIRDYSLQSTLTPKQRLDAFLEDESSKNINDRKKLNDVNERNEIRDKMKSSFRTMDCYYLPCPVSDGTDGKTLEDALQTMDKIEWTKLRQPFREGMDNLCKKIKDCIRPKRIDSISVNGKIFAGYIKEIVENINSNETIYLTESLTAGIKLAAFESLEVVKKKYLEELNKLQFPIDWTCFDKIEIKLNDECVEILKENVIGKSSILNETLMNFAAFKNLHCHQFRDKNGTGIFDKNYLLAKRLWTTKMDPKLATFNYTYELRQFIETLKIEYDANDFKKSKDSEEAWRKWIENVNLSAIEKNIEDRRKTNEKIKVLEEEKVQKEKKAKEEADKRVELEKKNEELRRESARVAADEARKRAEIERRNEELQRQLERKSNSSSYSDYSTQFPGINSWLSSSFANAQIADRSDTRSVCSSNSRSSESARIAAVEERRRAEIEKRNEELQRELERRSQLSSNRSDTRSVCSYKSGSSSDGRPRCKDGSLDMRYSVNKGRNKYDDSDDDE
jgi:hypothetical protein